jgi:hypothetical protein
LELELELELELGRTEASSILKKRTDRLRATKNKIPLRVDIKEVLILAELFQLCIEPRKQF